MEIANDKIETTIINGVCSMYLLQKDNIKPRKLTPCIKSLNKLYILFIYNTSNNSTNHSNSTSNSNNNCHNIQVLKHTTYDKSILSNCQEKEIVLFIYNTFNNNTNHNDNASNRRANGNKIQVLKHITYDQSILSNCQEMSNKLHNVVYGFDVFNVFVL